MGSTGSSLLLSIKIADFFISFSLILYLLSNSLPYFYASLTFDVPPEEELKRIL